MGVKVLRVAPDYRELSLEVPLRWYGRNMHGTMFGGFMCAVSDPLPTLLCERIFKGVQVWTRKNAVEFHKPARSRLSLTVVIRPEDIATIEKELELKGQTTHTFEFSFIDKRDRVIATVSNTVYLRRKQREALQPGG